MPMMLDSQLEALKNSKEDPDKSFCGAGVCGTMQGCHTYDILANPSYFDNFQYVPVCAGSESERVKRADIIKDDDLDESNDYWVSDKVRVGLNFAFLNFE